MTQFRLEIWRNENWTDRRYNCYSSVEHARQQAQSTSNQEGCAVSLDERDETFGWCGRGYFEPVDPKPQTGFKQGAYSTCLNDEDHYDYVCETCGACRHCCACVAARKH